MPGGYVGKILFVDLSNGEMVEERPEEQLLRDFIGGHGLGAKIIYDRQRPGVDPLGPENTLGFLTGPLTGTPALLGCRYVVVGKSPLTNTWGDANSGGYFGPHLKFAGFDGVFFTGSSPRPVYLWIDEAKAELRDASKLWGKDTCETEDLIRSELGQKIEVACIGPAGEKGSLISCIINNKGRAAGRSGLGAVMGSKRLKAIAVRGTMRVPLADGERVRQLRRAYLRSLVGPDIETLKKYGQCGFTYDNIVIGGAPIKNWAGAYPDDFPDVESISGPNVTKYQVKKYACWRCPIACGGIVTVRSGPFATEGHKPEYETLAAAGAMCLNDNVESIIKINDICNRYGLDSISAPATVAFAMECYENGLITTEDLDGMDLTWGNAEAIVAMVEKIGKREGFGEILADGVKAAAAKIGKGAERYAIHIQGQELPMPDPRCIPALVVAYQMLPTPARHTQGSDAVSAKLMAMLNALGVCINAPGEPEEMVKFVAAATGWDFTMEECLRTGERIVNMRHAFNLREGLNPLEYEVPGRAFGRPPLQAGPLAGITVDVETKVKEYLEEMDWDPVTTKPSQAKLAQLGLEYLVKDIGYG